MKYLLLPALVLLTLLVHSQTRDTLPDGSYLVSKTDSTDIKLQHYKDMFSKGLITAVEYEQLKDQLLGIKPTTAQAPVVIVQAEKPKQQVSNYKLEALKAKGVNNLVGGGIGIGLGCAFYIADGLTWSYSGVAVKVVLTAFGTILSVAGVVSLPIGIVQMSRYEHYKRENGEVLLRIAPNNIGLAYAF